MPTFVENEGFANGHHRARQRHEGEHRPNTVQHELTLDALENELRSDMEAIGNDAEGRFGCGRSKGSSELDLRLNAKFKHPRPARRSNTSDLRSEKPRSKPPLKRNFTRNTTVGWTCERLRLDYNQTLQHRLRN